MNERTDGQTDAQPENIMPPPTVSASEGIKTALICDRPKFNDPLDISETIQTDGVTIKEQTKLKSKDK